MYFKIFAVRHLGSHVQTTHKHISQPDDQYRVQDMSHDHNMIRSTAAKHKRTPAIKNAPRQILRPWDMPFHISKSWGVNKGGAARYAHTWQPQCNRWLNTTLGVYFQNIWCNNKQQRSHCRSCPLITQLCLRMHLYVQTTLDGEDVKYAGCAAAWCRHVKELLSISSTKIACKKKVFGQMAYIRWLIVVESTIDVSGVFLAFDATDKSTDNTSARRPKFEWPNGRSYLDSQTNELANGRNLEVSIGNNDNSPLAIPCTYMHVTSPSYDTIALNMNVIR